jgi:Tfp pilus assembly protein PilE
MEINMNTKGGYSFVELILVVVFAAMIMIALTAYLGVLGAQKKIEAFRALNDNLGFAMETISKEIRMSSNYDYVTPGVYTSMKLVNSSGINVFYRLNSGRLERATSTSYANPTNPYKTITSPELTISTLLFYINGQAAGDGLQPRVRIILNGTSGTRVKVQNLETVVSQRKIDS